MDIMDERRKIIRKHMKMHIQLFDVVDGELVGFLLNFSKEGALVFTRKPIKPGRNFRLRMEIPEKEVDQHPIFDAQVVWCKPDTQVPLEFNIGLKVTQFVSKDIEVIEKFLQSQGML